MGEFYAWAVTGQVSRLRVWSDAGDGLDADNAGDADSSVRIATRLVEKQEFLLRSRDGREMQVHLTDSGVALQNGHFATVAWAAREGAQHGHCIFVQNHTTGATARLLANIQQVRSEVSARKVVAYGALAAVPAAFALVAWLFIPGNLAEVDATVFLVGGAVAVVALFSIAAIVAKLVLNYLHSEDDEKIWAAVRKAMAADIVQLQRPARPSTVPSQREAAARDAVNRASTRGHSGRAGRPDR
jgi:hypothetical protein